MTRTPQEEAILQAGIRHAQQVRWGDAALHTMPYNEYLRTADWEQVRQRALARALNRCQLCNSAEQLEVHHRTYERRGYEWDEDVIALCGSCHTWYHSKK